MKSRFIFLFALWAALILPSASTQAQADAAAILTPPAPTTPRINGANVFGARPGSPFLYTIPATGARPMEFSAKNLPDGLTLDMATGHINGALKEKGEFIVTLGAKNSL